MDSGEEIEGVEAQQQRRRKRYHRHTPRQIQELESVFKECPHPDEKQRMQLSRELGLEPRQIKFWFQNRRTQMKAQHERADNCSLRAENDKIRCENIAIREALKKVMCPTCGTPPVDDSFFDEQKLRMENARLKEELERMSTITSKYLGRPITQLPPAQPIPVSSLDLSVGGYGGVQSGLGPSLDLHPGSSSSAMQHPYPGAVSEMEKPIFAELATNAIEELIRIAQTDQPLWMKPGGDGIDVLNLETYERIFARPGRQFKGPDTRVEASRDSMLVIMNAETMVEMFFDPMKWAELFSTIVSKARIIEVLAGGIGGSRSGSLVLMHEELQVLSPVVPKREFIFLRYFQQIEQGLWAIADVSVNVSAECQFTTPSRSRKLPSGCLIQEMPNGYSKVTWVEHMEIEDENSTHNMYRDLVESGAAFGAQRWLATLQRMCERFACLMVVGTTPDDVGDGVIPSPEGKRSMMKLAQRMVNNFCTSLSASSGHQWTSLTGLNEVGVRVSVHKSTDPGQPNGVVLSATTSFWLPVSSDIVFSFFKDERTRTQWDVLSNGNGMQEVAHITNGSQPGNCISLLRAFNASQNNMLILQESCTDSSGSLVVYAPVDLQGINIVMSGEDPSYVPLLPSGFAIVSDGRAGGASTSSSPMTGSLITVAFQILVSSLPSAKLSAESVNTVNNLIGTTVQQIKAGLNCSSV